LFGFVTIFTKFVAVFKNTIFKKTKNMKRNLFFILIFIVSLFSLTINSCKKDTPDTETQSSVDNSICEGEFNKSLPIINSITIKEQGVKSNRSNEPTISVDTTTTYPKLRELIIDFGTTGITDSLDNKTRMGIMTVTFDTTWNTIGAIAIVKLNNFKVANSGSTEFVQYAVDSMIITHTGVGSFTHNVIGGKCIAPDWNLEWDSKRVVTQIAGAGNDLYWDDVFSTTGSSSGKDRNGKPYTVTITSPIIKRATCSWMESGTLVLTPSGFSARTIDYGSGTCDSKATLTINGNTFTFNMN
jgi:hypothetical protein